jgi:type IV pilus assembly protein PilX
MLTSSSLFARQSAPRSQRGLALVFVLIMMSIATGIALIAARITLLSDRASRNDSDRQVAFQSAELALQDARDDIMNPKLGRSCQFGTPTLAPGEGCLTDSVGRGVCASKPSLLDKPIYKDVNWEESESSASRAYVNYGEFTGRLNSLQVGTFGAPVKAPKYIVVDETSGLKMFIPGLPGGAGGILDQQVQKALQNMKAYRVFALGYGASVSTQVMLESVIVKPQLATQCTSS